MRVQEHLQQRMDTIYRVKRIFAIRQPFQILCFVALACQRELPNELSMRIIFVVNQHGPRCDMIFERMIATLL